MAGKHALYRLQKSQIVRRLQRKRVSMWAFVLGAVFCALAISSCASSTVLTTPPTPTTGAIRITTDLSNYSVSQAIGVTVTNTSQSTYYVQNDHSACSFVQLQRYVGGASGWVSVDPCGTLQATQVFSITPGLQEPFTLAPTSSGDPNAWDGGTYRVQVSYTINTDGVTNLQSAYSAGFTVHS